MKVDKKNPFHWLYLVQFGIVTLLALLMRGLTQRNEKNIVILYGHKLNGNLKGIYDYSETLDEDDIDTYFLTMDPDYCVELERNGANVLLASRFTTAVALARSAAIVSDHGLHLLILLLRFSNIKFFDVWHSIPFKGFDADDFRVQRQYEETWVTSRLLKKLYIEKYEFAPERIHEIGYARTDVLVNVDADVTAIKRSIGIDRLDKKVIIFSPTWVQDERSRNIFPFGMAEEAFLTIVDNLCDNLSVICIFRAHLNTPSEVDSKYANIVCVPHSVFPNTEEILLTADIMVCDWSSIAFDYLLLDRPTIFLDIPAPFAKGFSLDETYRFGHIVHNMEELLASLEAYISSPKSYLQAHGENAEEIKRALYDDNADGLASKRCVQRLCEHRQ